ncbi:MAG TPA: hypothetical protein P5186_10335 [Candidatus Paceibacterota bacterium]|nr:hypothetical protein [Candidatus Paceibacterota bacterium]
MPEKLVPPIEPPRDGAQKLLHPRHQVPLRRFHYQMKVIGHQAERKHLPTGLGTGLPPAW